MVNENTPRYRWYVVSLAALTTASCVAAPQICMSVLFDEISKDLGLNLVELGWVWGILPVSGLLTVLMSGLLADRFGGKRTLIFACILAGLASALRGLADSFTGLVTATFVFGFLVAIIPANAIKVGATWCPPQRLGLATGILTTGMGVGFTVGSMISATVLSPMLGGWRNVFFLYGALSIVISLLWMTTVREPKRGESAGSLDTVSFREAISHVLHRKSVWLIGLATLGFVGCLQGTIGYLPLYLRDVMAWPPASADGTLAAFSTASTLGAIPISLLSDKLGGRKAIILPIIAVSTAGIALMSIANGATIWIIMILVGLGRDGVMALITALNIESEGIGPIYAGTAIGLNQTIVRTGGFISPPTGNSLAAVSPRLPFLFWAVFGLIGLLFFFFTRETGYKKA